MTAPLVSFSQRWTLFQHLQFIIEKRARLSKFSHLREP